MAEADRYIFRTQGVCPPEIHFQIKEGILTEVDFRGGGCPGNAQLVCRLIKDRSVEEVRPFLKDIQCQNQTSCPAELDKALEAALRGIRQIVSQVVGDMDASGEAKPAPLAGKHYSGEFRVRIPPDVHRALAMQAAEQGISLNRLASAKLAA